MNANKLSLSVFVISFCLFCAMSYDELRVDVPLFLKTVSVCDVFHLCLGLITIVSLFVFMLSNKSEEEKK